MLERDLTADSHPALAPLGRLAQLGLVVRFSESDWVTCLVLDGARAFVGHGLDRGAALASALEALLPSPTLRADWLAAGALPEETATSAASAPSDDESPRQPPAIEPEAIHPTPAPPVALVPSPALAPPTPRIPSIPEAAALAALEALENELDDLRDALFGSARQVIRLAALGWVAEARAVCDRCPGSSAVVHRTGVLVRELSYWMATLWPGLVSALRLDAIPSGSRDLLEGSSPLRTWAEVGAAARGALERLVTRPSFDEDGWASENPRAPRHRRPEELMREVIGRQRTLEQSRRFEAATLSAADEGQLVELGAQLRWIRGELESNLEWGRIMGWLRRIAASVYPRPARLLVVLDDERPAGSGGWAKVLGRDPDAKDRRRERRGLLDELRSLGSSSATLLDWLIRAGDLFSATELAAHLEARKSEVVALEPLLLPSRSARKRLKRVQAALADPAATALEVEPEIIAPDEGDASEGPTDEEATFARVLPAVRGIRVLFVGNRADAHLERTLSERLELGSLEWLVSSPRANEAAADRIRAGRYDLVMCATGFISHSTEGVVRSACQSTRVRMVRVNKGRLAACLRALERDFGLAA